MADNFLQFSTEISNLNKEERAWCEAHLSLFGDEPPQEKDEGYEEFTRLAGIYELEDETDTLGFDWKFEDDGLWIVAELNGNPDHVAHFMQMFLQKFRPKDALCFSWATTCSRPLLDEFGGGAAFITAKKIQWNNVWDWADQKWRAFRKGES